MKVGEVRQYLVLFRMSCGGQIRDKQKHALEPEEVCWVFVSDSCTRGTVRHHVNGSSEQGRG